MAREAGETASSSTPELKVDTRSKLSKDVHCHSFIYNKSKLAADCLLEEDFPFTQLTPPLLTQLLMDVSGEEGEGEEDRSCFSDGTSSTEFDNPDEEEDEIEDSCRPTTGDNVPHVPASPSDSCSCADLAWCLLTSACLSRGESRMTLCG
jgi:hypothetical protein